MIDEVQSARALDRFARNAMRGNQGTSDREFLRTEIRQLWGTAVVRRQEQNPVGAAERMG